MMEAWFALRRISNRQIAQRRVACVMLSEAKHLCFVSVTLPKALTKILRCAQDDKHVDCLDVRSRNVRLLEFLWRFAVEIL